MKSEKIAQKWKLIRLTREKPSLAIEIVNEIHRVVENDVYRVSFDYGFEKGKEIAKSFKLSFEEVGKFLGMISGVEVEIKDKTIFFSPCPVNAIELVKAEAACKGYLEGFFIAFNFDVEVVAECKEKCVVEVRLSKTLP
ncbi:MAG: hypothetical protein QXN34_04835 [Archaeoglobaceae archaeon]